MPRRYAFVLILLMTFSISPPMLADADESWTRFRGPNGSGISSATTVPVTWTDADYNWQIDLPGRGASSPVIWGDKIFITSADDQKLERRLYCCSTKDGHILWEQGAKFPKDKKHAHNTYATSTPAVDAERVYVVWQTFESSKMIAYDHEGRQQWEFDLGPFASKHGGGSSPIVESGVIAFNNNQEGISFVVGIDAASGKEKWRVPREKVRASYSTPCVFKDASGNASFIFTSWKHGFTGIDAQTGKVLWETKVFDPDDGEEKRAIGSPFFLDGQVYGTCGFTNGKKLLIALRPGSITSEGVPEMAFRVDKNVNHMPTAIAYKGRVYAWNDTGIVSCVAADTGKVLWAKRAAGAYSSSPICVNGKLYCLSEDGEAVVLATGDTFEELGRTKLPEGSFSTPAVADGVLYIRTHSKLLSIGGKTK